MKIEFVLPQVYSGPAGGYAVVYEYANRLAVRGHAVTVRHMRAFEGSGADRLRTTLRRPWTRSGTKQVTWFGLDPAVRVLESPGVPRWSARADVVVATAWQTAGPVHRLGLGRERSFYLIQHHELFSGTQAEVNATWRLPLTRLAIAQWLVELGSRLDPAQPTHHLPNAVNDREMGLDVPPADRDPFRVCMMWHHFAWKGSDVALEAFRLAQQQEPRLRLSVFSGFARPEGLQVEAQWQQLPSRAELRTLLNQASVFLAPSESEGWPLPPAEAMTCGAALLSTDIPGVADYADPTNAVLTPVGDAPAMARALLDLVHDDGRREQLALAGHRTMTTQFTWDLSTSRLERYLAAHTAP